MANTTERIGGSSSGTGSTYNGGANTVSNSLSKVADAAAEQFPTLADQLEVLKKDVSKLATQVGSAAQHQMEPIEQYVEREPLKAVLMAAGLGCVLGFLFSRR